VIAGTILVRDSKVTGDNRSVDRRHNFGQSERFGRAIQDVATTHTTLRTHQPGRLEGQKDLLEVGLRETRPVGDITNGRGRALVLVQGEA
jgi:hypothetical protein